MMRKLPRSHAFLGILLLLAMVAGGCAGMPARPESGDEFEIKLNALVEDLLAKQAFTAREMAPATVMPGALKTGTRFTRLEEMVMERLKLALRKRNELYELSRQNWFEFREGRLLSFMDQPPAQRRLLRNLIVYQVGVSPDNVLNRVAVHITGADADGRAIPGAVADATFDFGPESLARRLYNTQPVTSPFPEGLEERPYASLDRLSFSLAAELADAYRNGISAGRDTAADEEVRVLLYAAPPSGKVSRGLVEAIQDSLQQAIVSNRGFTCVVSQKDFGPAFNQIDFYRRNKQLFQMEEALFTAGTVLLMVDTFRYRPGDEIGVALRGIWRASPLETDQGDLIPTNVAGTYLSGFTAKAYLSGDAARGYYRTTRPKKVYRKPVSSGKEPMESSKPVTVPAQDLDVCFYDFTDVLEKRIYPVLTKAPNVTEIRRADELCDGISGCLCYELWYEGPLEDLSAWLRQNLRTSKVVPFRLEPQGDGRLNVRFDGGFK